jgi:hypothetical protein
MNSNATGLILKYATLKSLVNKAANIVNKLELQHLALTGLSVCFSILRFEDFRIAKNGIQAGFVFRKIYGKSGQKISG